MKQVGRVSLGLAMALAAVGGSSGSVWAQAAPTQTVTFTYTGAAQTWTVPAGVSRATFDAFGAQGGTGAEAPTFSGPGGLGGQTTVTLSVTAGQVIQVNVGQAGANGNSAGCSIGYPMKVSCGGFNGGATSGLGGVYAPDDQGGGGGGASDVRVGAFGLGDRVVVAGGGGGSGFSNYSAGVGGGPSGTAGADVPPCTTSPSCSPGWSNPITAGRGGTQSAGGVGGAGQICIPQYIGAAGAAGAGGAGQQRGGGGGGGWYGGGGGSDCAMGTAGGGGSGYSSVSGAAFHNGVRSGNGLVTITFTTASAPATTATPVPTSAPVPTLTPTPAAAGSVQLPVGQRLKVGDQLLASNGTTRLLMQADGNLVLYRRDNGVPIWASNTWGKPMTFTLMQSDGNLVGYGDNGVPYWASGTCCRSGATFVLRDDGNMQVLDQNGTQLWSSNTHLN